jgi:hypothetical protein
VAGHEGQGHQIFVDELARFAAASADQRVTAIAERACAPLCVAVHGRRGVGRRTVADALAGASSGIAVTSPGAADLDVYVFAEVIKPEDRDAVAAAPRPALAVLTKADLGGWLSGGAAHTRCAQFSELVGVPVEPMIGLLAGAGLVDLDADLWAALRTLAAHPGGAGALDAGHDGFLTSDLPVPVPVPVSVPVPIRRRLLATLDLFGTALGIAAIQRGRTPAQVRALWRKVSRVDAVVEKVRAVGAEVRYRRVLDAVAELEALAVCGGDLGARITEFLSHDDTVLARMDLAMELAGLDPDASDGHLFMAVRWQRYSRGAVNDLQRACGADIARGSLRLHARGGR